MQQLHYIMIEHLTQVQALISRVNHVFKSHFQKQLIFKTVIQIPVFKNGFKTQFFIIGYQIPIFKTLFQIPVYKSGVPTPTFKIGYQIPVFK